MKSIYKICHFSSVHPRMDTRIFFKECMVASEIAKTYLIVADGKGEEIKNNISIIDIGKPKNRLFRMLLSTKRIYKIAKKIDADIYHFHDPELIHVGKKLAKKKKKVIYDVHEDFPKQVINKTYLPKWLRNFLAKYFEFIEKNASKRFASIVTSTEMIAKRFLTYNKNVEVIYNYPIQTNFSSSNNSATFVTETPSCVCYVGNIAKVRGIVEIVHATYNIKVPLLLAGIFDDNQLFQQLSCTKQWENVVFYGYVNNDKLFEIFSKSFAGLVTLHKIPNYLESYPVKMFEYMAAGLPVIASQIPVWEEIINTNECGICVDPLNIQQISDAILFLKNNPDIAKNMGENSKKAIKNIYNWDTQKIKLSNLYKKILNDE